jgi:hypothetical protein
VTHKEYQNTHAWQQAIELSLQLQSLIEELPAEEKDSLIPLLRESMVNIPAKIAMALIHDSQPDMEAVLRLQTQLEIISRVYPAIEIGSQQDSLGELLERLSDGTFQELVPEEPKPEPAADDSDEE